MSKDKTQTRTLYMFFSAEAAKEHGANTAKVTDADGSKRTIDYTALYEDAKAKEYKWPDKQLVWSGQEKDMKITKCRDTSEARGYQEPFPRVTFF